MQSPLGNSGPSMPSFNFPILLPGVSNQQECESTDGGYHEAMELSQAQLAVHFSDRLRMLKRSADAYDDGDYAEAARLSGSIIKLIGDRVTDAGKVKKTFISLSTRLGMKPQQMADMTLRGVIDQPNLHGPVCVAGVHLAGAAGLTPLLDGFSTQLIAEPLKLPFATWWDVPVLRDSAGNEFSRRVILETMRDQEEAHTDGELDDKYAQVAYNGAFGISQVNPNAELLDENPSRVVVRHIAQEVLRTFVPGMERKYLNNRGRSVHPINLIQFEETDAAGNWVVVTDRKRNPTKFETTDDAQVWQMWSGDIQAKPVSIVSERPDPKITMERRIRMATFNFELRPVTMRAMFSERSA